AGHPRGALRGARDRLASGEEDALGYRAELPDGRGSGSPIRASSSLFAEPRLRASIAREVPHIEAPAAHLVRVDRSSGGEPGDEGARGVRILTFGEKSRQRGQRIVLEDVDRWTAVLGRRIGRLLPHAPHSPVAIELRDSGATPSLEVGLAVRQ